MAHHKSAKKRIRISEKANERNRHYRSLLRTAIRKIKEAADSDRRRESFRYASSVLDRLVGKGIISRNTAARRKSRLSKFISKD